MSIFHDISSSATTTANPLISTQEAIDWLNEFRNKTTVNVSQIAFSKLDKWKFDSQGDLCHDSGKFFSITGIEVRTNYGRTQHWNQPIIDQPEVGFLGIISRKINGILHFLVQAKIEPGNINSVQFSPTLQATKSNYTQVHKGNIPTYLKHFQSPKKTVILDQLQSEQGARFLKKRNRNIIINLDEEVEPNENFIWLTLGQLLELMTKDNTVNMDMRTVLSGLPLLEFHNAPESSLLLEGFGNVFTTKKYKHTLPEILSWITDQKSYFELTARRIPLGDVRNWVRTDTSIEHESGKFFSIIGAQVEISNREVRSWSQPIIRPCEDGIIAFLTDQINGATHFLVQGKVEAGNFDIVELAPTVQCITGSYTNTTDDVKPDFLDTVLFADKKNILIDTMQSEEGGRFYQEQNRNVVVRVDSSELDIPSNYIWIGHDQLKLLIQFNNFLNIQARSLLAAYGLLLRHE